MNTHMKDRLRCAYEDCAEAHPLANESTYEQVTCLTCRAALGLPPTEIYKNSGETVAATPKPRAGEYELISGMELAMERATTVGDMIRRLQAERDSLRERERELVEALRGVLSIEDTVTRGQESERRAEWLPKARALLAKHGR